MAIKTRRGDITVQFTEPTNRVNLQSGESIKVSFGKIKKYFSDLKPVAFSGSYEDLTDKPSFSDEIEVDFVEPSTFSPLVSGESLSVLMGKISVGISDLSNILLGFATASWSTIHAIAQAGKASYYWKIGDTKNVTLNTGEVITLRIEDFDHDDLVTGDKAKMTLGMVNCLNATRQMNSSNTNSGGWGSSAMRTWMTTFLGQMPSDLQSVIKQVTKTTSAGNASSSLTTTNDKLWLFSATEVGQSAYNVAGEGTQYPLFISDSSRVKSVNGLAEYWWLRSPIASYNTNFCSVKNNGAANAGNATSSVGVAVGFCI